MQVLTKNSFTVYTYINVAQMSSEHSQRPDLIRRVQASCAIVWGSGKVEAQRRELYVPNRIIVTLCELWVTSKY